MKWIKESVLNLFLRCLKESAAVIGLSNGLVLSGQVELISVSRAELAVIVTEEIQTVQYGEDNILLE